MQLFLEERVDGGDKFYVR